VEISNSNPSYVEIARWNMNLYAIFGGANVILQVCSWNSGAGVQGTCRLYNVTDATTLLTVTNTLGSTTPTIYESTDEAPANATKDYTLEMIRDSGAGNSKIYIRGGLIRR
jgi:hypothetical protein